MACFLKQSEPMSIATARIAKSLALRSRQTCHVLRQRKRHESLVQLLPSVAGRMV
jgi:hypothetical protein